MNNRNKLNKEYFKGLGFALIGIIMIHSIFLFNPDSRGEIISVFFCSILMFILITLFNLIFFLPIKKLFPRLILPGLLTIVTPIIFWKNKDVSITQYLMIGVLNLLIGLYFYINKIKNKLS